MVSPVAWRRGLCFVSFLLIISLCACGRGVSQQVVRAIPGSQNVPVSDISTTAAQSLRYMGYSIQEIDAERGYLYARKTVVEDPYGRNVEMKVNVIPGPAGEKQLSVEATTCPGCVPQATFDPAWMADRFYTTFDLFAARAGLYNPPPSVAQESYPQGQFAAEQTVVADDRVKKFLAADAARKVRLGVTIEDVTKESAASLGLGEARGVIVRQIEPESPASRTNLKRGDVIVAIDGKPVADNTDVILILSPKSPGDVVTLRVFRAGKLYVQKVTLEKRIEQEAAGAAPSLPLVQITRIAVNPQVVPARGTFDVIVDYSAKDPATQLKQVAVQLTIEILQGEKVLYTHKPIEVNGENGGSTRRTEPLAGSAKAGAYTVRVTVRYGDTSATGTAPFTIQ